MGPQKEIWENADKSRQGSMAGRRMQETGFYGSAIRQVDAPAKGNVWNGGFRQSGAFVTLDTYDQVVILNTTRIAQHETTRTNVCKEKTLDTRRIL